MESKTNYFMGLGRRKTSTVVVKMRKGKGNIAINSRSLAQYFPLAYQQAEVIQPLAVTDLKDAFDLEVKVQGGGNSGQIGAIKLGISRALTKYDPALISKLREYGLLTRDPRMKERKKYGQKGARKRFQWTKR